MPPLSASGRERRRPGPASGAGPNVPGGPTKFVVRSANLFPPRLSLPPECSGPGRLGWVSSELSHHHPEPPSMFSARLAFLACLALAVPALAAPVPIEPKGADDAWIKALPAD